MGTSTASGAPVLDAHFTGVGATTRMGIAAAHEVAS
jgi:hypothetical protein